MGFRNSIHWPVVPVILAVAATFLGLVHYAWEVRRNAKPTPEVAAVAREVAKTAAYIAFDNRPIEQRQWVRLCMAHRADLQLPEIKLRRCMDASRLVFP